MQYQPKNTPKNGPFSRIPLEGEIRGFSLISKITKQAKMEILQKSCFSKIAILDMISRDSMISWFRDITRSWHRDIVTSEISRSRDRDHHDHDHDHHGDKVSYYRSTNTTISQYHKIWYYKTCMQKDNKQITYHEFTRIPHSPKQAKINNTKTHIIPIPPNITIQGGYLNYTILVDTMVSTEIVMMIIIIIMIMIIIIMMIISRWQDVTTKDQNTPFQGRYLEHGISMVCNKMST